MKLVLGFLLAFLIGAACRYFEIPVPAPPKLVGALLVLTATLGYVVTDSVVMRQDHRPGTGAVSEKRTPEVPRN